jgi:hypothetical protein
VSRQPGAQRGHDRGRLRAVSRRLLGRHRDSPGMARRAGSTRTARKCGRLSTSLLSLMASRDKRVDTVSSLHWEPTSRRSWSWRALRDPINDNARTGVGFLPARRCTHPGRVRDDRLDRGILLAAALRRGDDRCAGGPHLESRRRKPRAEIWSFSAAARKMYELMGRLKGEDSSTVHKAGHFRLIAGILISLAGHRIIKRNNRL